MSADTEVIEIDDCDDEQPEKLERQNSDSKDGGEQQDEADDSDSRSQEADSNGATQQGVGGEEATKYKKVERELYKLKFDGASTQTATPAFFPAPRKLRPRSGKTKGNGSKDNPAKVTEKLPLKYDDKGFSVAADGTKTDLCDCLRVDCPGCFFCPCSKCGSFKCGPECRIQRKGGPGSITTLSADIRVNGKTTYNPLIVKAKDVAAI